jgi:DNA-directed RNA polymerase subunit M/transcription elongation factor TFIIS
MSSENTIKLLSKFMSKKLAEIAEKSIYDFSNEYATINDTPNLMDCIYDTKVSEIITALEINNNLINNEEIAEKIALLKPEELNPEKYEKLLKKIEIEEFKKQDVKSSSAFTCSKCKSNKCSVTQKQTRAGDEPATTYVTCLECKHAFSFN